ncbi:hypothetical protein J8273_2536 [Carpediemonas membranifera]|uniref:Uncharacterized protein n=1 Tax=Carpediemonas membranifera TaxID=201153 RepID=A0A8J6B820_9EUKA|nr:hypothetical protein J8273_2536 [Carpediemonas membranifera]|eukprot:KAG9396184.1 hypothetical protein J8273_2536 [Carpediemonas membranifera]
MQQDNGFDTMLQELRELSLEDIASDDFGDLVAVIQNERDVDALKRVHKAGLDLKQKESVRQFDSSRLEQSFVDFQGRTHRAKAKEAHIQAKKVERRQSLRSDTIKDVERKFADYDAQLKRALLPTAKREKMLSAKKKKMEDIAVIEVERQLTMHDLELTDKQKEVPDVRVDYRARLARLLHDMDVR